MASRGMNGGDWVAVLIGLSDELDGRVHGEADTMSRCQAWGD